MRWRLTTAALCALVAAGLVGYLIGHRSPEATFATRTGLASFLANGEGTASFGPRDADGLAVGIPWIEGGTVHEGPVRPGCLPPGHERRVQMGTVRYPFLGGRGEAVVWIRC